MVQGLCEFLPVSSSGHLRLVERLFGIQSNLLIFEIAVHLGTLLAVLVVYRQHVGNLLRGLFLGGDARRLLVMLLIATLPAAIVGPQVDDWVESLPLSAVGLSLIGTAVVLTFTRNAQHNTKRLNQVTARTAFGIGLAQALAILPGLSRSGVTITAALLAGLAPGEAASFSFLLAIPVILGAGVLGAHRFLEADQPPDLVLLLLGATTAAVVGFVTLLLVQHILKRGRLWWFAPYCFLLGVATILVGWRL